MVLLVDFAAGISGADRLKDLRAHRWIRIRDRLGLVVHAFWNSHVCDWHPAHHPMAASGRRFRSAARDMGFA